MDIREKQILILRLLKERRATISPVGTHEFQEKYLFKKLSPEDIKVSWGLLDKKGFIRTDSNAKAPGVFYTFLTDEGVEEIERFDREAQINAHLNETKVEMEEIELENLSLSKSMVKLTRWVVFGSVGLVAMEIIKIIIDHTNVIKWLCPSCH